MSEVTELLEAIQQGKPQAAEQLLPLVYAELRRLAAGRLSRESPSQTLQPTALVHEAYLRLVGGHRGSGLGAGDNSPSAVSVPDPGARPGEKLKELAFVAEDLGPYDDRHHRPHPGGLKLPNAFGLYDMLGNVWEHCSDWHAPGSVQEKLQIDPRGPNVGVWHVLRGGAWYRLGPVFARASSRQYTDTHGAADAGIGFRVALVGDFTGVSTAGYRPGPARFGPWQ